MSKLTLNKLGDPRAEMDHDFLDKAFYETPEYKTILESEHRKVVVGRRGTGKSSLYYQLHRAFKSVPNLNVISISPNDDQMIGLRHFTALFGERRSSLRAAASIAWQYALTMEVLRSMCASYKVKDNSNLMQCSEAVKLWEKQGASVVHRMVHTLDKHVDTNSPMEKRVAMLSRNLNLDHLKQLAVQLIPDTKYSFYIIADRLDEGYEPSDQALAVINGLLHATSNLSSALPKTRCVVFIRDNILRAIQEHDPDYSRDTEGDVLRLHWDEYHLFNMICNRIRTAYAIDQEQNLRAWNAITERDIQGSEGFRRCLRLTLYRPRDLVLLLNRAIHNAAAQQRDQIVNLDIEASAKEISCSRLDDLKREYEEVIPGLAEISNCFVNGTAELQYTSASERLKGLFSSSELSPRAAQHLAILGSSSEVIRQLFSIGFLGIWQPAFNSYVFSHDGKQPDFIVGPDAKILIHPCYWIALNLKEKELPGDELQTIHDDYDIEVTSETPEIRKKKLGQLMAELDQIPLGQDGSKLFEEWCLNALRVVFASGLVNIEHHPNRNANQRRDIVGRNTGNTETWKRILHDYNVRQTVFEAKNYTDDLGPGEYRQMLSYMCGEHGRLSFIINRADSVDLLAGKELAWCQEIYHEHDRKVVVKLTAKHIHGWLSKLRNLQKHDAPDKGLGGLLDRYERMYLRL